MEKETQKKKVGTITIREAWDAFDTFMDDDAIRYWLFNERNYSAHTDYERPHDAETVQEAIVEMGKNNPEYHIFPLTVYEHGGRVYYVENQTVEEWAGRKHNYGWDEGLSGCVAVLKDGISREEAYKFANEQTKILNKIDESIVYDIVIDNIGIEGWLDSYEVKDWFKQNLDKYDYDKIEVDGSEDTLNEFCQKTYTPSLGKILGE